MNARTHLKDSFIIGRATQEARTKADWLDDHKPRFQELHEHVDGDLSYPTVEGPAIALFIPDLGGRNAWVNNGEQELRNLASGGALGIWIVANPSTFGWEMTRLELEIAVP